MKLSEILAKIYVCPQELFIDLWDAAASCSTFQRTTAEVSETLVGKLINALEFGEEKKAVTSCLITISSETLSTRQEEHSAVMSMLRAIDDIFLRVHPRVQNKAGRVSGPVVPAWLRRAELKRLRSGAYWRDNGRVLIPRGPLLRVNRKQFAAGGEAVEDYFSSLTLASTQMTLNHRQIQVRNLVVPIGGHGGVPINTLGDKSIVFVPLAIAPTDLELEGEVIGHQGFMTSTSVVDAAEIVEAVLQVEGPIDLLIAPEMTIDELSAERLSVAIRKSGNAPRLTIAGSGNTVALNKDGLAWNESAAINEFGHFLWRQRKMWISGIPNEKAEMHGFPLSPSGFYLERNAESEEIVIADIDGFGRCCILICQDLQSKPLAAEILRSFQPDWVFCPILDPGIRKGGWAHQRAFDLSSDSNARFVISSSLSLVARPVDQLPAIGLAIGPKAYIVEENDKGRAFAEVSLNFAEPSNYGKIIWGSRDWTQTEIRSKDIVPVSSADPSKLH